MASLPRALLRPTRHALARYAPASGVRVVVPRAPITAAATASGVSRNTTTRGMATVGNLPPMEPQKERPREMNVGELEGAEITIEPLRRVGEDDKTMRARLVYQSRKRGILETDLVLSTFADEYLPTMTRDQMAEYDRFLDENDWDIYYWATQEDPPPTATPTSASTADVSSEASTGGVPLTGDHADTKAAQPLNVPETEEYATGKVPNSATSTGEWAQTVGTFKPAYRPVPSRWRDSETLRALREHVRKRSGAAGGMAFMPKLRS